MERPFPITTIENECQDCYKCVRQCPVKAIKIEDGRAAVIPERCVACGHCVMVCPVHAKRVRDDLGRARLLLKRRERVLVSLAPSWIAEYPDISPERICAALLKLGFHAVSETAIGAQLVSADITEELKQRASGVVVSTACPAAVAFAQKYMPAESQAIWPIVSPMLAHARWLREIYGPEIGIVFIGPCVAKKYEADLHRDDVDVALTFVELQNWLEEDGIELAKIEPSEDVGFMPFSAREGAVYPIEGGMLKTLRLDRDLDDVQLVSLTGLPNLQRHLEGIHEQTVPVKAFIEIMACEGGCINGPGRTSHSHLLRDRLRVQQTLCRTAPQTRTSTSVDLTDPHSHASMANLNNNESDLLAALQRVGKTKPEDELNCSGCGYDSCRQFAQALLDGRAEPAMCVSYMRQRAYRKANALLRSMPSGVVIVDANMTIIECNENFARMFGEETEMIFQVQPGLKGAKIEKIVPFSSLFERALKSGRDIQREHITVGSKLLAVSIFSIDPGHAVGGIMLDVTNSELRREQIAKRAREVIQKNLQTVQEIACRLGEHMAETEILLRDIAEDYADDTLAKGRRRNSDEVIE